MPIKTAPTFGPELCQRSAIAVSFASKAIHHLAHTDTVGRGDRQVVME
jgi:hypothetical protein